MFFDDELIAVGRASNKRNNLSMASATSLMLEMCNERIAKATPAEKTWTERNTAHCFNYAMKVLFKEGYSYMNPERFKLVY
jgi:hypothetical protein